MRRKLILISILFCCAIGLGAQSPTSRIAPSPGMATFDPTQAIAAFGASSTWNKWADTSITALGVQFIADEAKEAGDHAADLAAIAALQTQLASQAQAIATMQTQIQALQPAAPSPVYALAFSPTPDRANAVNLNGATVKGMLYIFTAAQANIPNFNPAGIGSVCYMLDGKAVRPDCEGQTPYDFLGGAQAAASPWSSATVVNGPHSVTQKVTTLAGITETDIATFTVAN